MHTELFFNRSAIPRPMMDLERRLWRMNENLIMEEQRANTTELKRLWKPFDWTKESK
ncbi:hypothetical protein WUBG_15050 [Wuchereria bancrofti]|uniref:Uncharacterized protein n=1 Tax=Wuchereria bancrofti TaxID=6293 RepID=J9DWJ6_WUCBA|nr:hypothetical protein WUBG_15050 [Wuchereria bancrofti]